MHLYGDYQILYTHPDDLIGRYIGNQSTLFATDYRLYTVSIDESVDPTVDNP